MSFSSMADTTIQHSTPTSPFKVPPTGRLVRRSSQDLGLQIVIHEGHSAFLQNYVLGERFGGGGFGHVHRARRISDNREVVVKEISSDKVPCWCQLDSQLMPIEVVLLMLCQDLPGIVRFLDAYNLGQSWVLVMDRVSDVTSDMFDYIGERGTLPEYEAAHYFLQLLGILLACHRVGVLHRDIKDENILINRSTNELVLIDFGSGAFLESRLYTDFDGTRVYCPPEWILKNSYYGKQAEVWSLGVLLYDMLCGDIPFVNDKGIIGGKLRYRKDNLSHEAKDLIGSCLNMDPDKRPTLMDILQHPWMVEHRPRGHESQLNTIMIALNTLNAGNGKEENSDDDEQEEEEQEDEVVVVSAVDKIDQQVVVLVESSGIIVDKCPEFPLTVELDSTTSIYSPRSLIPTSSVLADRTHCPGSEAGGEMAMCCTSSYLSLSPSSYSSSPSACELDFPDEGREVKPAWIANRDTSSVNSLVDNHHDDDDDHRSSTPGQATTDIASLHDREYGDEERSHCSRHCSITSDPAPSPTIPSDEPLTSPISICYSPTGSIGSNDKRDVSMTWILGSEQPSRVGAPEDSPRRLSNSYSPLYPHPRTSVYHPATSFAPSPRLHSNESGSSSGYYSRSDSLSSNEGRNLISNGASRTCSTAGMHAKSVMQTHAYSVSSTTTSPSRCAGSVVTTTHSSSRPSRTGTTLPSNCWRSGHSSFTSSLSGSMSSHSSASSSCSSPSSSAEAISAANHITSPIDVNHLPACRTNDMSQTSPASLFSISPSSRASLPPPWPGGLFPPRKHATHLYSSGLCATACVYPVVSSANALPSYQSNTTNGVVDLLCHFSYDSTPTCSENTTSTGTKFGLPHRRESPPLQTQHWIPAGQSQPDHVWRPS